MRKRTWIDVGIAVLGLFLVCSGAVSLAQQQDAGMGHSAQAPAQGINETGQVGDSQQSAEVQQLQEIARLRAEVARLQQELARMQAQPSREEPPGAGVGGAGTAGMGTESQGTGGSGTAGSEEPTAQAPAGATGSGDIAAEGVGGSGRTGGAQAARPDTSTEGVAVANVIYTGRVRSVSSRELVLVDEGGGSNTLLLSNKVRVFRGREQLSLQSLREGALVRASADLYARGNPVTEIQVLPSKRE